MAEILNSLYNHFSDSLGMEYADEVEIKLHEKTFIVKQNRKIPETGGIVWDAAIVLSEFLCGKERDSIAHKRVIELGAGTGLLGTSICSLTNCSEVFLTDTKDYQQLIQQNVDSNSKGSLYPFFSIHH